MTSRTRIALLAAGALCAVCAFAAGDTLTQLVSASNVLIGKANDLRTQQDNGVISHGDAQEAVAKLLPDFDDIDARALAICRQGTNKDTVAEAADLTLHGSLLQCLYALTAKDKAFPGDVGYVDVYYRAILLPDFRPQNEVNDPHLLVDEFSPKPLPIDYTPWVGAEARAELGQLQARRLALYTDEAADPAQLIQRLEDFSQSVRSALTEFERTGNRDYLAVYLKGKLLTLEAYTAALALLEDDEQRSRDWLAVSRQFEELSLRAAAQPEALLSVFAEPQEPDMPKPGVDPWSRLWRWWDRLWDNFNQRKPIWLRPRQEPQVIVQRLDGDLVIRGRSQDGWHASGLWTKPYEKKHFRFTVDMGGQGEGYYLHMRTEGDNGAYAQLAFGMQWADTIFEVWQKGVRTYAKSLPRAEVPRRDVYKGKIEHNMNNGLIQAFLGKQLIGRTRVDLGENVTYAICVSSGKSVMYDAWFDSFDVQRFIQVAAAE
ncbi:MAG: hypothetical protein ACE5R4_04930 [Armatimonadota bacterium]